MTFFGGDHSVSHYSVSVRYIVRKPDGEREDRKEQNERWQAERAALKAKGVKVDTYYQYKNADAAGKAKAKQLADKEAARIKRLTGVTMEVAEGCFL